MKKFIINALYNLIFYKKNRRFKELKKKLRIGENVLLNSDISIGNPLNVELDEYIYIGPRAILQTIGKITIKRGTIIGPDLRIYTGNHDFRNADSIPYGSKYVIKNVFIEENVWIGGGVIILPGVTIGEGSIVGAGSVVSRSIPNMSIVAGNPAKIIGKRNEKEYFNLKSKDAIYLKLKKSK